MIMTKKDEMYNSKLVMEILYKIDESCMDLKLAHMWMHLQDGMRKRLLKKYGLE